MVFRCNLASPLPCLHRLFINILSCLLIGLVELVLGNVYEEPVETAHTGIALFFTSSLARSHIIIAIQTMVPTITAVATPTTEAVI